MIDGKEAKDAILFLVSVTTTRLGTEAKPAQDTISLLLTHKDCMLFQ